MHCETQQICPKSRCQIRNFKRQYRVDYFQTVLSRNISYCRGFKSKKSETKSWPLDNIPSRFCTMEVIIWLIKFVQRILLGRWSCLLQLISSFLLHFLRQPAKQSNVTNFCLFYPQSRMSFFCSKSIFSHTNFEVRKCWALLIAGMWRHVPSFREKLLLHTSGKKIKPRVEKRWEEETEQTLRRFWETCYTSLHGR